MNARDRINSVPNQGETLLLLLLLSLEAASQVILDRSFENERTEETHTALIALQANDYFSFRVVAFLA